MMFNDEGNDVLKEGYYLNFQICPQHIRIYPEIQPYSIKHVFSTEITLTLSLVVEN